MVYVSTSLGFFKISFTSDLQFQHTDLACILLNFCMVFDIIYRVKLHLPTSSCTLLLCRNTIHFCILYTLLTQYSLCDFNSFKFFNICFWSRISSIFVNVHRHLQKWAFCCFGWSALHTPIGPCRQSVLSVSVPLLASSPVVLSADARQVLKFLATTVY